MVLERKREVTRLVYAWHANRYSVKMDYHSFSEPNVRLARLQMEFCRAANIFAARLYQNSAI